MVKNIEASSIAKQQVDQRHDQQQVNKFCIVFADSVVKSSVAVGILKCTMTIQQKYASILLMKSDAATKSPAHET